MKIDIRQIPPEGLILREEISAKELDLETDIIKICSPLQITARVRSITNVLNVEVNAQIRLSCICSRCLGVFERDFKREFCLDYQADNSAPTIDLNPDIRDEFMLDYPIKPLCRTECRGLCPGCGSNLNEGKCNCRL
ncbi:MAG: DUF177 domain-containing protein [Candidatus Omnitrophota bacterium]